MRQVIYNEPWDHPFLGPVDVAVRLTEASARIEARHYWAWVIIEKPHVRGIVLTDDQMLEEWMMLHWAWFDEL